MSLSLSNVQTLAQQAQSDPEASKLFTSELGISPSDFSALTEAEQRTSLDQVADRRLLNEFTPSFSLWRHDGWYVSNARFPEGHVGVVSNKYDDQKWRVVGEDHPQGQTYPDRDSAARAVYAQSLEEHRNLAPFLGHVKDQQLSYVAASLFKKIANSPNLPVAELAQTMTRIMPADPVALTKIGQHFKAVTTLGQDQQKLLADLTVNPSMGGGYTITNEQTHLHCATVIDNTFSTEGLLVLHPLLSKSAEHVDEATIRAAVHAHVAQNVESQVEPIALAFGDFKQTAKYIRDLSQITGLDEDKDMKAFVYAGGGVIESSVDSLSEHAYSLTIGNQSWSAMYRSDLEPKLYEHFYLSECVSPEDMEKALRVVFDKYPEFHDKTLGSGEFSDMVEKFAADDFYPYNQLAKSYKNHCDLAFENYPDFSNDKTPDSPFQPHVAYPVDTHPALTMSELGWPRSEPVLGYLAQDGSPSMVIFQAMNADNPADVTIISADSEGQDMTGKLQAWSLAPSLTSLQRAPEPAMTKDDSPSPGF